MFFSRWRFAPPRPRCRTLHSDEAAAVFSLGEVDLVVISTSSGCVSVQAAPVDPAFGGDRDLAADRAAVAID